MNCHELELQLTPYVDGELGPDERVEIEAHLAGCTHCAHRADVERHNISLVRALVHEGSPAAPGRLRQTVFDDIHREEAMARRVRILRLGAAAAGMALAVVVGNQQYRLHQLRLYEQDAALRHARQFPLEIRQPQADAIEAWFGGKLDHPVTVPRFPNATATGARLLQVRDKPAAYIRYDARRPSACSSTATIMTSTWAKSPRWRRATATTW
jgi:anti-sigma factor (TIGR02949 family)